MVYPKISIVTPSFNQGQFIEETIDSVLSQRYPNLEYIIIDGGSTDNSVEIIKKYEKQLKYWVSEPDQGHGHALNKGFTQATGDIMAWLNSDDKYLPWTFKTVAEIFQTHKDINWISGIPSAYNEQGCLSNIEKGYKNVYDYGLYNYEWIQQESCFWSKDLWDKSGRKIDESMKYMVDGELWSRFFLYEPLYHVDAIIGGIRQHENRRALQNLKAIHLEMSKVIDTMRKNLNPKISTTLNEIQRQSVLFKFEKSKPSSQTIHWIGKMLPPFIFNRYVKYKMLQLKKRLISCNINYKTLNYENGLWEVQEVDYMNFNMSKVGFKS